MKSFDVIIVGGGIIGVTTALSLAQSGLTLALIEPAAIGAATTAASMGHLTILDGNADELALSKRSLDLWLACKNDLPRDNDFRQCGTIWLAEDDEELAEAKRKAQLYQANQIRAELLDEKQLAQLEPHLARDLAGGLRVPDDAIIYPPLAAYYFFERALALGVITIRDRVIKIEEQTVTTANQQRYHAERIIVCAGNQSVDLLPHLPIKKKKGQLAITERGQALLQHQVIELGYIKKAHLNDGASVAANLQPRPTQQILIGSSRQFGDNDSAINWSLLRAMLQRAQRFVPTLNQQNIVRVWTGFRPTTPDNLPLIGALTKSIWVNAGHEGLGIATSLASAELITQQIHQQPCTLNSAAFAPTRIERQGVSA